jgi:formylglycine-generating enzyme required for sulfatase activity
MSYEDAIERNSIPLFDQTVLIVPGSGPFPPSFLMGGDSDPSEEPQHPVTIARPFSIGRFPVTQEEYLGFCLATKRAPLNHSECLRRPATGVPWRDAMMYCDWLNRITGERYRLPTEAEWEYACRGGTTTRYSWDDTWDNARAHSSSTQNGSDEEKGASDVDTYDPNPWGLWDMHGNAAEWCADPWHDDYADNPPSDGSAWIERGDFTRRVQRGGSRFEDPRNLRSAFREADQAESSADDAGFRVARTL